MSNHIQNLQVQNFKSLRNVSLRCERINLLVGKPNVGKSNLLEAMALLEPNYLNNGQGFGRPLLRYEQVANLFFDQGFLEEEVLVSADSTQIAGLKFSNGGFKYSFSAPNGSAYAEIDPSGAIGNRDFAPSQVRFSVKFYIFTEKTPMAQPNAEPILLPPNGANFFSVLQTHKALRKEASELFEPYGLELLLDPQANRLDIVKREDGILFKTPYGLVADTLRRYLFHLAAIESNRNAVLLFEEPESHNFPPYIRRLARRIIESKTNQFFITTHSPFLFNTIVEEAGKDVAVFVLDYEDHQTKVRRLSEDELREVLDYGLNIFTEQELFADAALS